MRGEGKWAGLRLWVGRKEKAGRDGEIGTWGGGQGTTVAWEGIRGITQRCPKGTGCREEVKWKMTVKRKKGRKQKRRKNKITTT